MRLNDEGENIKALQQFLNIKSDGIFGKITEEAVKKWQQEKGLLVDGIIGPKTLDAMKKAGLKITDSATTTPTQNVPFPSKPSFPPLTSKAERDKLFGKIEYVQNPSLENPEGIRITNGFETNNIVRVDLPQLAKATNGKYTAMRFHKDCAYQLRGFFQELEEKGLLDRILSYGGAYNARFIRGSKSVLSNHAYGTAFDINMVWNPLGKQPSKFDEKGCVYEIVPVAHKWGFYWGGHFTRLDGMHFEIAKIIEQ
jgi:hypothetical protein